jgi:transcriptional regulator with XRE-family HTH domain
VIGQDVREDRIESIGDRILRLRKEKDLTQKDLAGEKYSSAFVSIVESGRRRPSDEAVRYFAERLGVEPDELLTGRPAHLAVELEMRLAAARHAVSTGDVTSAGKDYAEVRVEARSYGLRRLEAKALEGLARCAERGSDITRALCWLDDALACLADEPLTARVPALVAKARIQRNVGQLRDAAYLLETALERLERDGLLDPEALVQLQYGLVGVYIDLGLLDRAATAGHAALSLAGQVENPEHVALMHMQVARTFMLQGQWYDAEDALNRAHATFRQLDYAVETAMCHWARGYILLREERLEDSERELTTARDMMRSLDAWYYAGALASELATVLWRAGRPAEALAALDDAWRLERESPTLRLPVADAYRLRGLIARDAGDNAEAEHSLRRAFDSFLQAEAGPLAASTARLLGDLLRGSGQLDDAIDVYRAGLAAAERTTPVTIR